jgi:hypothetical protein
VLLVEKGNPTDPVPGGFIPHSRIRTFFASDPRGYFGTELFVDHDHNSLGWRDDEHTLVKPANTLRVLGLGDSYLWGQGVRRQDICLERLRLLLDPRCPGAVETLNMAKPATNTRDQMLALQHIGLDYDPDLVLLHFVLNDVEPDLRRPEPKIEFLRDYTSIYLSLDWLSEHSHIWGWARQRYLRSVQAELYLQDCVQSFQADSQKWRRCRRSLDTMADLCRQQKIGFLVVIFPFFHNLDGDYPFQAIHDTMRRHCQEQMIPVLDLLDHYRDFHGPELWVHPTDQHPNEIAHEIAAGAIAKFIIDHLDELPVSLLTKSR